jgi:putative MATE family efflux protein
LSEPSTADCLPSFSSTAAAGSAAARPVAPRTKLLLEGPILPTLLRLAAPNILNLLAIAGMITFDGLFVGRLGRDALAGVSLAFPFVMLIQHTAASGMGGGVSSAIARALGAGKRDIADALVLHAFVLALGLAAAFSTLLLLSAPRLFSWMGGQGEIVSLALAYANVAFSGAVSICMLNLLGSAVRGTGNMSLPAGVIVGSGIAHIAISPVLIFGWGPLPALGVAGAGWGLIIPFGVGSLVLLVYLRSRRSLITLTFRGASLRWGLFAEILKVGVPGLINVMITNLSVVLLTGIAGHLGREAAIGYAMGARLEYILIPLAFGFGTAIVAMVGTNWGARQYRRARKIAWTGAAIVATACATIGLIVALFPALWMGLFSDDPEVVRLGTWYLRIVGPVYGLYGLGMALYFATQGLGSVTWTVTANALRLLASSGCALAAIHWLDLGAIGFVVAIAGGFCVYAALTAAAMFSVKEPFSAANATTNIGGASRASKLRRWWLGRDKSRSALAALDDDQLCNLSDIGRQIRHQAQLRRAAIMPRDRA